MTSEVACGEGELEADGRSDTEPAPGAESVPPRSRVAPFHGLLTPEEVAVRLAETPGWSLVAGGQALERSFEFATHERLALFVQFTLSVAGIASFFPSLNVGRDQVTVHLTSPDSGGWTGAAFDFAAALNRWARGRSSRPDPSGPAADAAKTEAQARLEVVLGSVDEVAAELAAILATLPAVGDEAAEAMEEGSRPQSLAHHLQATIECLQVDHLTPLRQDLERLAGMTAEELVRRWEEERGEAGED